MDPDLLRAGLRPPLARALLWASGLWAIGLLLPVRLGAGGPIWMRDLWGAPAGQLAVSTSIAALVIWAGLGRLAGRVGDPALGWWALAAAGAALAGLLGDPDAGAALLPLMPSGLSRGYLSLVLALGLGAACLRAPSRTRAALFGVAAAAALAHLYLWPHPFGSVADQVRAAWPTARPSDARHAAAVTQATLAGVPALLVVGALGARLRFGAAARRGAPYLLATVPALVFTVGLKGAATLGGDSHSLLGLRGAIVMAALLLVVTFGAERAAARPEAPLTVGRRSLGHGLALLALAFGLSPHLRATPEHTWTVGEAPDWATTLYRDALPQLFIAADGAEDDEGLADLALAAAEAHRLAAAQPDLQAEIDRLAEIVHRPRRHRRALEHLGGRINAAARRVALPFYLDLQVVSYARPGDTRGWMVHAKTYRLVRARRFRIDGRARAALWLERLDGLNLTDARLGWTRHDAPEGMVVLDVVRAHWREDLAPALSGVAGLGRRRRTYARHAATLVKDLSAALEGRAEPGDLPRLLRCLADDPGLYAETALRHPRRRRCATLLRTLEPTIVEVLAEKVEAHELQHVADGSRLAPPQPLLQAMRGYDEAAVRFGAAELSAYLAEVARSPTPKLALTHFLALAQAQPRSAEGFAGRVAVDTLRAVTGLGPQAMLRRPRAEVRSAASAAYRRLFGHALANPELMNPAPPSATDDGGAPVSWTPPAPRTRTARCPPSKRSATTS